MGHDISLRGLEQLTNQAVAHINEKISQFDWNKKFRTEYSESPKAKETIEELKRSDVKDSLREVFSEQSLALSKLWEAF